MNLLLRVAVLLAALCAAVGLRAQELLPVPALTARVMDQTGTLTEPQRAALESKLAAFEASSGTQIAVLMVAATAPEELADFTQRVGDAWKLGRADVGDGLLLVVAKNERRVRIAVAKTLQGAVPDLAVRQIIDQHIRPAFRTNDYAGGLNAAADALVKRVQAEALPAPTRSEARPGLQLEELAMFFFIAVPIAGAVLTGIFGRKVGSVITAAGAGGLGWWLTASLLVAAGAGLAALVVVGLFGIGSALRGMGGRRSSLPHIGGWSGGGGFGGGGFGSGGGGFSSGGGGDFDGGGASGDW